MYQLQPLHKKVEAESDDKANELLTGKNDVLKSAADKQCKQGVADFKRVVNSYYGECTGTLKTKNSSYQIIPKNYGIIVGECSEGKDKTDQSGSPETLIEAVIKENNDYGCTTKI